MFYKLEDFANNYYLTVFINLLIFSTILLIIPMCLFFLIIIIKPKIKNTSNIYLYAISSGMLLIVATVGFLKDSYFDLEFVIHKNQLFTNNSSLEQFIIMIIVASGSLFGIILMFLIRFIYLKFILNKKSNLQKNNDQITKNKSSVLTVLLFGCYKIISGFILGTIIANVSVNKSMNISLLITFNFLLLVELLIIYYRQIQYKQSKQRAIIYNLSIVSLFILSMFIGAFLNSIINSGWWLIPLIKSTAGTILVFVVITEFIYEFIHLRNKSKKEWYLTLIFLALAMIITLLLLSFNLYESDIKIINNNINIDNENGSHYHNHAH
ncbi:hypothetical protein [Mesomycoplasma lagogenitalium]|uniref:Uncharacterized protein n=1 Tax=Mesomycoplasma lagogenitalium TaxID=171286 RepID=A0ABY8LUP3_9BACT|nr:hypothetical protein [Mesomycoplasma lagogenitalium]WGI36952.1 hypothetical protein QEG99_01560 [Mesomycoplasma lagogenitalium]